MTRQSIGRIVWPTRGTRMPRSFEVTVDIFHPIQGRYYYIANKIGNLMWPKNQVRLGPRGGRYKVRANEGGNPPGGVFEIILIEVDRLRHQKIQQWFKRGRKTGDYPGLRITGRILSRVRVRLR